jgi:predicted dithiol-disulfide oxidoreductase (DUF899 family)
MRPTRLTDESREYARHFYSAHPALSDEINQRGLDLLNPVWHLLDLTPEGRGDRYAQLEYDPRTVGARG